MENSNGGIIALLSSGVMLLVCFAILIVLLVAAWKLYVKAGKPGWAAIVPFYNIWVMGEIIYGSSNAWKCLLMLLPGIGGIFGWLFLFRFAQVFGKEILFCVLNIFFPYIIMPMMAFGSDNYKGPINSVF